MVAKAIDEGLLARIQNYVSVDLNRHRKDELPLVKGSDVFILSFARILNSWKATANSPLEPNVYYQIIHDGSTSGTIAKVYTQIASKSAII